MEPSTKKDLIHHIQSQKALMVSQLHQFCSINSGTENSIGLKRMVDVLHAAYEPIADSITLKHFAPIPHLGMDGTESMIQCGDALFIRKRPGLKKRVLLCGHMDSVYPETSPFQNLTYLNEGCINGPAVADMKGGLIVMLHALSAFEQSSLASQLGWDVLINADEEIGSPASSALLDELAPQYQAALVFEPAMTPDGTLAKNRKGSGKITLIAKGKAAHAGRAFDEGKNAICHLAKALLAVHGLNGQRLGVTINVGKIAGGQALNVVPDQAVVQMDVRISAPEDETWVRQSLERILEDLHHPEYSLILHAHFGRPVKRITPPTERLFARLKEHAKELNIDLDWQDSGGCCDGNNLARKGLAVLDTLGVCGGNIHSDKEFILLDSLPERAALSALLLQDLAQGGLEALSS
jgi:glutamate carboxypeptidase